MLPVMKRLYGHETRLDVDDPDGYAYGVSTYHFNMCIAGLVEEIDKSFSYVPYIGFSRTSREIRETLHNWLKRTECGDKPGTDIKESKKSKPVIFKHVTCQRGAVEVDNHRTERR